MSISKSERMRAGLRPSTITRSASSTASSMLWVTMKIARRRHLLAEPQLQQFGAQVLGGKHIERRERLVHEEHFGLDHQRARESDALLHAAGKFFGISRLEAVEADGVDHLQSALVPLDRAHAARDQRRFHVLQHRKPGKKREALKDDGRRWESARPSSCRATARGPRKASTGRSACAARWICPSPKVPASATILPGRHTQVGRRNHFNAIAVRLRIVLLDRAGFDDGLSQRYLLVFQFIQSRGSRG